MSYTLMKYTNRRDIWRGPKMAIEYLAEDIIYVTLPKMPHINCELEPVNELIITGTSCDVILDFQLVDVITSASISSLLILQNLLNTRGRQLILCNVAFLTKCEFTSTALDRFFRFVKSKDAALKALRREPHMA